MSIYMIDDEEKALNKVDKDDTNNAATIPAFNIHSKTIGNENGSGRITTHVYEFNCHRDNGNIFKALLARCSDGINNAFHFIPFGLSELTIITTYMHQIKLQNNCIASMTIIPIHGVTKTAMKKKVKEIRLNEAGIYRIEETRMIEQKGNWFVVRNKPFKQQVKWKVELILREITLHIMYSTHT